MSQELDILEELYLKKSNNSSSLIKIGDKNYTLSNLDDITKVAPWLASLRQSLDTDDVQRVITDPVSLISTEAQRQLSLAEFDGQNLTTLPCETIWKRILHLESIDVRARSHERLFQALSGVKMVIYHHSMVNRGILLSSVLRQHWIQWQEQLSTDHAVAAEMVTKWFVKSLQPRTFRVFCLIHILDGINANSSIRRNEKNYLIKWSDIFAIYHVCMNLAETLEPLITAEPNYLFSPEFKTRLGRFSLKNYQQADLNLSQDLEEPHTRENEDHNKKRKSHHFDSNSRDNTFQNKKKYY